MECVIKDYAVSRYVFPRSGSRAARPPILLSIITAKICMLRSLLFLFPDQADAKILAYTFNQIEPHKQRVGCEFKFRRESQTLLPYIFVPIAFYSQRVCLFGENCT